ncbi:MAG: fibronectin type III domain-containing protein [Spirochaetia bacterium]|nr:fibronectin type III domain-containing protein [Spirochaetia bacterium]
MEIVQIQNGFKFYKKGASPLMAILLSILSTFFTMNCSGSLPKLIAGLGSTDETAPSVVASFTATPGGASQINLSWSAAADNTTPADKIYYEICQNNVSGGCNSFSIDFTTSIGAVSYSVTGLTPNTTYYFKIRAVDEAGNTGAASVEANATTSSAGTVNSPTFTPAVGIYGATQNIALSSSTSGSTICYTSDGTTPACSASAVCTTGTAYSAEISVATSQTIQAIACKETYTQSPVNSAAYTIDLTGPSVPGTFTATAAGPNQINLSWIASTDNTTAQNQIVYEVCQSLSGTGCNTFSPNYTTTAGVVSYSVTGLNPLTTYNFVIRAKDSFGNPGGASGLATAITNIAGSVNSPTFTPAEGIYGATQNVFLNSSTTGSNFCYTIDGSIPACDTNAVCTIGASATSSSSIAVSANKTILAIACKTGYTPSPLSTAAYTIDTAGPTTPGGFTATTAGSNQINLSWTVSTDNTTPQSQIVYELCQVAAGGGCDATHVPSPGSLSYSVTGLNPATSYNFVIRSKDTLGNSCWVSAQAMATTSNANTVNTPAFTPVSGTYTSAGLASVSMSSTTAGSIICYTTNGVAPACDATPVCTTGTQFSAAISVASSQTVKAIACKNGNMDSNVETVSYIVDNIGPTTPGALTATTTGATQINLAWNTSTDITTAKNLIVYEICQASASSGCSLFAPTYTTAAGSGSYLVTGLSASTAYFFVIRAKDSLGNAGTVSAEVNATTSVAGTLNTPIMYPASGTYVSIQNVILASATSGATVCYSTDGVTVPACSSAACTSGTQYTTSISIASSKTLMAMACVSGSIDSEVATASYVIDSTGPTIPGSITATAAGSSQINLSWAASADNLSAQNQIVYEICQGTGTGDCNIFIPTYTTLPGTTGLSVSGLLPATTYYFVIRARDALGNAGMVSTQAAGTTDFSGVASMPTFTPPAGIYTSASVSLNSTTTGSTVCYTTDGSSPACNASAVCTVGSQYGPAINAADGQTINAITCKQGYTPSSIASAVYTIDTTGPTVPGTFAAIAAGTSQINLSWVASTDANTAQSAIVYEICQTSAANGCNTFTTTYATVAGAISYPVMGLQSLTAYYFRIRTKDALSNIGAASAEITATTNSATTVDAPAFTPIAGTYGVTQNVVISSATSSAVICYTTNGTMPACNATPACATGTQYTSGNPVSVAASQTLNAIACFLGYTNSSVSTAAYVLDTTVPTTPATLAATTAGTSQINLSWTVSTDNITAQNQIVYEICQTTVSGGCNTFAATYVTAADSINYGVSGLNALATYYFKIRAKDGVGNPSTPTAQVSATTNSLGIVNSPAYTPISGIYNSVQNVSIGSTTGGATVCYTTNGVNPACNTSAVCTTGIQYSTQVAVGSTQTLKAIACLTGYTASGIASATYTIDSTAPTVAISYLQGVNPTGPFKAGTVTITATYSEPVAATPNISINQPGTTDVVSVSMTQVSTSLYTYSYTVVTKTGTTNVDGTAAVSLSPVSDLAGNTAGAPTNNTFAIDTTLPTIVSVETMDANSNGKIDHYKVTFSKPVRDSSFPGYVLDSFGSAQTAWLVSGYLNAALAHGSVAPAVDTANDNILYVKFTEGAVFDTGAKPDFTTTTTPGLTDLAANAIAQIQTATVVETDKAAPFVASALSYNATTAHVTFSEVVTSASAQTAARYTITGLTVSAASMHPTAGTNSDIVSLTTSTQTHNSAYTVTVTNAVLDMAGNGFASPGNTTGFTTNLSPVVSFAGSPFTLYQGIAMTTNTPTLAGGAPTSCTSSPTLPSGLSINATTCAITGTPTALQAATPYTITAGNAYGSGTASISIIITDAPGVNWSKRFPVLNGGTFGNNLYVVVGDNGSIKTSADGNTWALRTSGTTNILQGATWDGSQFVAVGNLGTILTSADGITWTSRTSGTIKNLQGLTWSGTKIVAVGDTGTILTSTGGITWTSRASGTAENLQAVTWSGSQFVAVGVKGTILTSADGITWTTRTSGTLIPFSGVTWSGSQFVAVGNVGTILTSADGITWTARTSGTTNFLQGVTWSGTKFVAVGDSGTILSSADGITWTTRTSGTTNNLQNVTWSGSQFVAVGNVGTILTSADGINWVVRTSGTINMLQGVTWGGSQFIAVGNSGTILTSVDGVDWTPGTSGTFYALNGVTWSGTKFVAVGSGGVIITSTIFGITWTSRTSGTINALQDVTWSGSQFVAVGDNGTIRTSADGITWATRTVSTSNTLWDVTWNGSQFAVVGNAGILFTSSDGITWTSRNSGTTNGLQGVTWNGSQFVAVGDFGTIVTSADGITWTTRTSGTTNWLQGVTWSGSQFVAVGRSGIILTSADGINWTSRTSGTTNDLQNVMWNGSQFAAVGAAGTVLISP